METGPWELYSKAAPAASDAPAPSGPWEQYAPQAKATDEGGGDEAISQSLPVAGFNAVGQGLVHGTGSIVAGVGRGTMAAAAQGTQRQLAVMDAIDQGKEVPQDQDVIGYQFLSPEQRQKARAEFTATDADLAKREPNTAVRAGMAIEGAAPEIFPISPKNEGHTTGVGRLVGGVVPALAATAVGSAVGGPTGGILASMAAVGSQSYDATYQDAIAKGATPEAAENAAGKAALTQAAVMAVPVGRLLQRVPMPLRDGLTATLVNLGQHGVEFGSANALGTFANNYVAQQTYDPERSLTQGIGDAALEGTIAGLIIPAVGAAGRAIMAQQRPTATDVMKAPDIDTAIATATKAAEAPAEIAPPEPRLRDIFSAPVRSPEAPEATIPKTSEEAKTIAGAYYRKADEVGGTLTPEFTNQFIDTAERTAPQTPAGKMIVGDSPITKLVDRIQGLRDEPITLHGAQEIDEGLGNLIDREFGVKGLTKEGKQLLDLQTTFRNMILDAGPEETTGGTQGFEALKQGRAAWAQAMKMTDLERIQDRAELTDNPATSIRSGIRVLLSNPSRVRGYSPEEVSALRDAASRGVLGSALHVFGSRLIPTALAGHGAMTLNPASLAAAGAAHFGTSLLRGAATNLQSRRLGNAMSVLGEGVPPAPTP